MPNQLTTAEMRARLEKMRNALPHEFATNGLLLRDNPWLFDLASAELTRREREQEGARSAPLPPPKCEECNEEMQPFATGDIAGYWCDLCGWSIDIATDGEVR